MSSCIATCTAGVVTCVHFAPPYAPAGHYVLELQRVAQEALVSI